MDAVEQGHGRVAITIAACDRSPKSIACGNGKRNTALLLLHCSTMWAVGWGSIKANDVIPLLPLLPPTRL